MPNQYLYVNGGIIPTIEPQGVDNNTPENWTKADVDISKCYRDAMWGKLHNTLLVRYHPDYQFSIWCDNRCIEERYKDMREVFQAIIEDYNALLDETEDALPDDSLVFNSMSLLTIWYSEGQFFILWKNDPLEARGSLEEAFSVILEDYPDILDEITEMFKEVDTV